MALMRLGSPLRVHEIAAETDEQRVLATHIERHRRDPESAHDAAHITGAQIGMRLQEIALHPFVRSAAAGRQAMNR